MLNRFLLISVAVYFVSFSSCTKKEDYDASVLCETNTAGDYVIKWEVFPAINENVRIYRSDDPDDFFNKAIELEVPAQNGVAVLKKGEFARSYFKLVFGKKLEVITSNRAIKTESILNFRGMGGYHNRYKQQVKWGKLYRSGSLSNASESDIALLKDLHIKTAVDLRTDEEIASSHPVSFIKNTYRLPLRGIDSRSFTEKVLDGHMKKGDALIFQQDLHVALVKNNTDNFKRYFEILGDSSNYPVVVYCTLGKERAGIIMALTLAALDVDSEQIHQDYMLSNSYMNFSKMVNKADTLSPEIQEALTALLASQREAIEYARKYIVTEYSSMDEYFEKKLQISPEKRKKLKELLLYSQDN